MEYGGQALKHWSGHKLGLESSCVINSFTNQNEIEIGKKVGAAPISDSTANETQIEVRTTQLLHLMSQMSPSAINIEWKFKLLYLHFDNDLWFNCIRNAGSFLIGSIKQLWIVEITQTTYEAFWNAMFFTEMTVLQR